VVWEEGFGVWLGVKDSLRARTLAGGMGGIHVWDWTIEKVWENGGGKAFGIKS
jgi:hypothetical protein